MKRSFDDVSCVIHNRLEACPPNSFVLVQTELLLSLSRWKKDFEASYVDQHIAAAGA